MLELQQRKRLGWVKHKGCKILNSPVDVALALQPHWEGVSELGLKTTDECSAHLRRLNLPPALFHLFTEEIVQMALDRLHECPIL